MNPISTVSSIVFKPVEGAKGVDNIKNDVKTNGTTNAGGSESTGGSGFTPDPTKKVDILA